jgi:TolB-like protein/DNA-binding winged helix-turn-helix (wHTH) protein/Flp pilus assembly protein TadD
MEANESITAALANSDPVSIGKWTFRADSLSLECLDNHVKLEPRVAYLLYYLVEKAGAPVSRAELMDGVWPGLVVGDEALTGAINKLRNAFGDDSHHPEVIKTIPKVGYQLIADVEFPDPEKARGASDPDLRSTASRSKELARSSRFPVWLRLTGRNLVILAAILILVGGIHVLDVAPQEPASTVEHLQRPDKPSIVVLPFINASNNQDYDYLSNGITDDLITDLSQLSGLFVIARQTSFQFKGKAISAREISKLLGVRYVLQGSVRRSGERFRVNVQLADGDTDGQIWANRYDGTLENVFDLQDSFTNQILTALAIQLSDRDRAHLARRDTLSSAAYDEFLKGWEHYWRFSRDDFAEAERHFRRALKLDPGYTRARAALALIYWQAWEQNWHANVGGPVWAGWVKARNALDGALDSPIPFAYAINAEMLLYNHEFDAAIAEANKAIELSHNDPDGRLVLARILSYTGDYRRAIELAESAQRLNPNYPAPYQTVLGKIYFDQKQYQRAADILDKAVRLNPRDPRPNIPLIATLGHLGKQELARQAIDRVSALQRLEKIRPLSIDSVKNQLPYREDANRLHLIDGLRKAGVREH